MPLDRIGRGVALCPKPLDEGLGVFNIRKADILPPQFDAPLLTMHTASSIEGAVERVTPVLLVEEAVQSLLVAGDRVDLVQSQPRSFDQLNRLHDRRGSAWLPDGGRRGLPSLTLLW